MNLWIEKRYVGWFLLGVWMINLIECFHFNMCKVFYTWLVGFSDGLFAF